MLNHPRSIGVILALVLVATASAAEVVADTSAEDVHAPRVALVLSGGGARGVAHLGVLAVLEEEGVPIDLVIGTSMGAIVGAMYATGVPISDIDADFRHRDWLAQFEDALDRQRTPFRRKEEDGRFIQSFEVGVSRSGILLPRAVLGGRSMDFMLRHMLDRASGIDDFDQLPIPFRAVATDLADGSVVVLGDGDLVTAVRASAAFPGGVAPVSINGRTLVDGGLAANLPIQIARDLGADVIIAVNVGTTIEPVEDVRDALDIANQVIAILTDRNVNDARATLTPDDLYIEPDLGGYTTTSFGRVGLMIDAGRAAAEAMRPQIAALAARLGRRPLPRISLDLPIRTADEIRIIGLHRVDERQVRARIDAEPNLLIDGATVHDDLDRIYAIGDFEQIEYRIETSPDDHNELIYEVTEKNWAPYYLRGGLRIENDFSGTGDFSIAASLRRTQLNALGGEWRTTMQLGLDLALATEIYQPLDFAGEWFVAPEARWASSSILLQTGPAAGDEWRLYRNVVALDLGLTPRSYGEVRMGFEFGRDRLSPRGQTPTTMDERIGRLVFDMSIDQLDDAYLPRSGAAMQLRHESQRDALGADIAFERTLFRLISAWSFREWVVMEASLEIGSSHGDDLPIQDEFELGGLGRLSGLPPGALRGDEYALGRVVIHGPMFRNSSSGSTPLRWGFSFELGNVWDYTQSIVYNDLLLSASAFGVVETPLGAIFLGYGVTEQGSSSLHLVLGRPF